jgi:hypothetical protein
MNSKQTAYQIAKAISEAAYAEKYARLAAYDHLLDSDEGIEEYTDLEMSIHAELNIDTLTATLRKTEDAMIDWALAKVEKVAFLEEKSAVGFLSARRNQPKVRKQLVDMSFRLA